MPSSNITVEKAPLKALWLAAFKDLHVKLGNPVPTDPSVLDLMDKTAEIYTDAMTDWFNTKLQITWEQDVSQEVQSITIEDR